MLLMLFHDDIRHSFGMNLLRKGYDIWQTSKALNHSSIKMTEYYAKMLASQMEKMYGRTLAEEDEVLSEE